MNAPSMHKADWMNLLLQKLMLAVSLKTAGATKTEVTDAVVQSAQQDVIDHLNAHPEVAAGVPVTSISH